MVESASKANFFTKVRSTHKRVLAGFEPHLWKQCRNNLKSMSSRNVRKLVKCELFHKGTAHSKTCFGQLKLVIDCECSIYIDFPLTRNWECSTKTSPFRTSSLERGKKYLESVSGLEKSNICNRQHCFGSASIAHLSFQVLSEIAQKKDVLHLWKW